MNGVLEQTPAGAYAVVVLAVLAESVLLVGAFVPTLTLLLAAGGLARAGRLDLPVLVAVAASAVVSGDFLAHRTGRTLGARMRKGRLGRRLPASVWQRAETLMDRRGGQAVFLGRFLPVVRTLVPHLAGAARLPYRRLAPASAAAGVLWSAAEAAAGYVAAASLRYALGPALILGVVAGAVVVWTKRRGRSCALRCIGGRLSSARGRSCRPRAPVDWWTGPCSAGRSSRSSRYGKSPRVAHDRNRRPAQRRQVDHVQRPDQERRAGGQLSVRHHRT